MTEPLFIKSDVPVGKSGDWALEHYDVPEPGPGIVDDRPEWARSAPGRHTRLSCGDTVFMTDGREEWWSQKCAIEEACRRGGEVLITGLGLGLVVESMFQTPGSAVEHITVLEASPDVIRLVAPHLLRRYGDKLEVVNADAFAWRPPRGAHYSVGWHDIWPNPYDEANLAEMDRLEQRYAEVCEWQGFWAREYVP